LDLYSDRRNGNVRRAITILILTASLSACEPSKSLDVEVRPTPKPEPRGGELVVEIHGDGRILWNGEPVSLEELTHRATGASDVWVELRLKSDGKANFEQIKRVMDVLEPTGLLKKAYIVGGT
jgi:biopolymer transport protein ExbD